MQKRACVFYESSSYNKLGKREGGEKSEERQREKKNKKRVDACVCDSLQLLVT